MPAINFAAKRWKSASYVKLHYHGDRGVEDMSDHISREVMQHTELRNLGYLEILWNGKTYSLAMFLAWMTARARQLRILHVYTYSLPFVPYISALKHVVLELGKEAAESLIVSLEMLPCLETLCLEGVNKRKPELALAGSAKLRSLRLASLVPSLIELPPSCQLHLEIDGRENMQQEIWKRADINLTTVDVDFKLCDIRDAVAALDGIGAFEVTLRMESIGTEQEPYELGKSLALIPDVHLVADKDLFVVVPAACSWRRLALSAKDSMCIRFADARAFVQRLPIFSATCSAMVSMASVLEVALEVQGLGDRARWGCCTVHAWEGRSQIFAHMASAKAPQEYDRCFCEACCICLARQKPEAL